MKRSHLIKDNLEGLYTLDPYMDRPADNVEKRQHMKKLLNTAMEFALTDRQRKIIEMHYNQNKKVTQIAQELGISRQAVHKTLKQSKKKLEKIKIFLKV